MITSPSNQFIALLRLLHTPKGREQEGLCLIEGPHLLEAALEAHLTPKLVVYNAERLGRDVVGRQTLNRVEEARALGAMTLEASDVAIERASEARTPQGVVAALPIAELTAAKTRARRRGRMRPLLLALDGVSDPGNLGTILRSALAADVDEVLLAPGCADPLGPKVVRAGAGAHFHLPVRAGLSWAQVGEALEGEPMVTQTLAAEAKAKRSYDSFDLTVRTALVIGNEAHGLSPQSGKYITDRMHVPMWNKVESLNAAIAASVIVFEAARQRRARDDARHGASDAQGDDAAETNE